VDTPFLLGALAFAGQRGRELAMEVLVVSYKRRVMIKVELHWCQ